MKNIFLLIISFNLLSCYSQNDLKIIYKDSTYEYQADQYPKSIIDTYKEKENLYNLSDREIVIKIKANDICENLIDNILLYNFKQNISKVDEKKFNDARSKLIKYYSDENLDVYRQKIITKRMQQWFADSIVQSKYGGKIYFDLLRRTPKPKEAYQKFVLELIHKNEMQISDEFLKNEIINIIKNYTKNQKEIECNFFLIETWSAKK